MRYEYLSCLDENLPNVPEVKYIFNFYQTWFLSETAKLITDFEFRPSFNLSFSSLMGLFGIKVDLYQQFLNILFYSYSSKFSKWLQTIIVKTVIKIIILNNIIFTICIVYTHQILCWVFCTNNIKFYYLVVQSWYKLSLQIFVTKFSL